MHEAAFAQAALPRRTVIFKMPLRDYSIAHGVWLFRKNNPFATGGIPETRHIIEAVLICAHSHAELRQLDRDPLIWLKIKIWKFLFLRKLKDEDVALAIADFWNYLAAGSFGPPTLEARMSSRSEPQRAPGAPFLLRLVQFLVCHFEMAEEAAWDYPMGLAKWQFAGYWEGENAIRIKNADEQAAEDEIEKVKKLAAEGVPLGEAFRRARMEGGAAARTYPAGGEAETNHPGEATCPA